MGKPPSSRAIPSWIKCPGRGFPGVTDTRKAAFQGFWGVFRPGAEVAETPVFTGSTGFSENYFARLSIRRGSRSKAISVVPDSVAEVAKTLGRIGENAKLWRVWLPANGRIWSLSPFSPPLAGEKGDRYNLPLCPIAIALK